MTNQDTAQTISTPRYFCPKHGDQGCLIGISITLHDGPDPGDGLTPSLAARMGTRNYCMCCWIDWMDANMERLTVAEDAK